VDCNPPYRHWVKPWIQDNRDRFLVLGQISYSIAKPQALVASLLWFA
jgi:hypothetical protein